MEDYSRDLEKELTKYSVPNPFKKSRRWQLLFISDDGKMVSVKRYKELVITCVVIMSIAVLSAACFSALYYKMMKRTKTIQVALDDANKELDSLKGERELLLARIHLPIKKKEDLINVEKKSVALNKKELKAPAEKTPKKKKLPKMEVGVKDLTMSGEEGRSLMRIRFIVRNTSKRKSIEGRVFVVLKPESEKQQDWISIPPTALKGGQPSLPSRGQFFSINHFKSVKFKFNNRVALDYYKKITIFVFSMDGKKVFEETFPIKADIKKKPVVKSVEKPKVKKEAEAVTGTEKDNKTEKPPAATGGVSSENPVNNTVVDTQKNTDMDSPEKTAVVNTEKPKVEGSAENEN